MKRAIFIFIIFFFIGFSASAWDFKSGDIYYNVTSTFNRTVEVTYYFYTEYPVGGPYTDSLYSGNIIIPDSVFYDGNYYLVISIGYRAFYHCLSLNSVTMPNTIDSINDFAFLYCSLDTINIPASVTYIGDGAFSACPYLMTINVDENNENFVSLNGILFSRSLHTLISYPAGRVGHYSIPNIVNTISSLAFDGCTGLTSVTIPNSVYTILDGAFYQTGLTTVTVPNSVNFMREGTFANCRYLSSVFLGNSLTCIDWFTFEGCENLDSLTIGNSVDSIKAFAFSNSNLKWMRLKTITPPKIERNSIQISRQIPVHIPCGTTSAYQSVYPWSQFTNYIEDCTTGIEETEAESIIVYSNNGHIIVKNAPDEAISVFDILGKCISYNKAIGSEVISIPTPIPGIYLVKIGSRESKKVVVH